MNDGRPQPKISLVVERAKRGPKVYTARQRVWRRIKCWEAHALSAALTSSWLSSRRTAALKPRR
jgi:hypothetical protein